MSTVRHDAVGQYRETDADSEGTAHAAICGWVANPRDDRWIAMAGDDGGWVERGYRELAADAVRVAAGLTAAGVRPGDAVCVVMPTGFDLLATMFGVWSAGGVLTVAAPPGFGAGQENYSADLARLVDAAAPRVVVASEALTDPVAQALALSNGRPKHSVAEHFVSEHLRAQTSAENRALIRPGIPDSATAMVQFTSGSSGAPKGVRISWRNLAANTAFIAETVGWRPGDVTLSWLPLYHDMGLVGAVLTTIAHQGDLRLMRPDQFVRDPSRWVRGLAEAHHTVTPSFGLGYAARRLEPNDVAGLDLSGLKSVISGAEPIDPNDVCSFVHLLRDTGFDPRCLRPAYGLAESTLMATMATPDSPLLAVRVDGGRPRLGSPAEIAEEVAYRGQQLAGTGWMIGLGRCAAGSSVRIAADGEGAQNLADGVIGEVVLGGPSVADGYNGVGATDGDGTRFRSGELYTGDAGFVYHGNLFVLGRIGTSVKVRGASVFMEDVESRLSRETGIAKHLLAAVAVPEGGASPSVVLFVEKEPGDWLAAARSALRADLGTGSEPTIVTGPRGMILRTSSGKPRRRAMWEMLDEAGGRIPDTAVHGGLWRWSTEVGGTSVEHEAVEHEAAPIADRRPSSSRLSDTQIRELLRVALNQAHVHPDATILLEGSIAEGFGNEGSDIDFLAVSPGDDPTPEMPTVLFVDGRRVEVRTRSEQQLREQLDHARSALGDDVPEPTLIELNQDTLNRCQRFLRAVVVRDGSVDIEALRGYLPHRDLAMVLSRWWSARADQSLRHGLAMATLGAADEAAGWVLDGVLQAVKAWAAARGETYLETKWLQSQLDRIGDDVMIARYHRLTSRAPGGVIDIEALTSFAASLGCDVGDCAQRVLLRRVRGVTSWSVDGRIHVLRGRSDVFVLSDRAAMAWKQVVFGRSLAVVLDHAAHLRDEIAEFVRLGFVALGWGAEPICPAVAMVKPHKPFTPPASHALAPVGIAGGIRDEKTSVTLNPLPAERFIGCASALVWSNVIVENAREDVLGAVAQGQFKVAEAAADRLVKGAVRMMLSVLGCAPLPPDVAPVSTVSRLMPVEAPGRAEVLDRLAAAHSVEFANGTVEDAIATLDALVEAVRDAAQLRFPASFDSHAQWRRTLAITYDWLRIAAFLDAELPIDEVQDLLSSGGAQPHQRDPAAFDDMPVKTQPQRMENRR